MRFGDIVRNEWAGAKNPHKLLIFLRKNKKLIVCLALTGESVTFYNDNQLRLTTVGVLDLSQWRQLARESQNETETIGCPPDC